MSTLQCANIIFESTGNNTLRYTSPNTIQLTCAGANVFVANANGIFWNGASVINTALAYTWSNTHTFQANTTANSLIATDVSVTSLRVGNTTSNIIANSSGLLIPASAYVSFGGATYGSSGYGLRDNSGIPEAKANNQAWYPIHTANNSRGMDLLEIVSVSGGASLSSATNLPSYTNYKIVFEDLNPSTNNVSLYGRIYNGAWAAGNYYFTAGFHYHASAGSYFGSYTSTFMILSYGNWYSANTTIAGMSGEIEFFQAANTSTVRCWKADTTGTYALTYPFRAPSGGYYSASTNAMSGFQLYASSGNITGKMRIYGYNV